ncbi:MAG: cobalt ECF transporter T component CbiQ [Nitrospirae bacterium]|nr:cobalt ECF transporter T component CbiQ [Nitrospirota bacterium]
MELFSEHFKKEHILSKTDARVKLIVVLALLVMVLSYKGMLFPLLIAACCFSLCLKMGIPPRVLLLRFSQPAFIALVVLLLKFFFTGEEALFSFNVLGMEITGHKDGFREGVYIAGRILGGISLVMAFGFATPFTEIMAGLSWLRIPKQFIEIMMFAYRYIFIFLEDGMTIYNAQKNRLGYAGIRKGMKSFGTLAGSLVIRGFDQSQKTSEAMIQRGYTGDMPVLKCSPLRFGEFAIAMVFIVFAGVVWMM